MVRFSLVGVPRVKAAAGEIGRLERRDAALLALLCLGGPRSRSELASMLWPQVTPDRARNSLRQRLHRLKRTAGREVVLDDGRLSLLPDIVETPQSLLEQLRQDPEVPLGGLLEGLRYDIETEIDHWLQGQRRRWHQAVMDRLTDLADVHEAAGAPRQALPYARRLLDEDPGVEAAHVRVVRLLYAVGDSVGALSAHAQARRELKERLEAEPGPELEAIGRLVRESHLHAASAVQPLPASLLRPPRLVGRDAERARISAALERRRLVVVVGEAGIGKSRLLQEVAQERGWPEPVAARPGDADLPYALVTRWLDAMCDRFGPPAPELLPELARLIPHLGRAQAADAGPFAPAGLLRAIESALSAWRLPGPGGQPGLAGIAIDDLQLADAASLELLLNLASDPRADRPVWMVGLSRDDLPPALQDWRQRLAAHRVEHITLQPLDVREVAILLESLRLPGLDARQWAQPLLEHVGGHPFDLLDTLALLHGQGQRDFSVVPALEAHPAHRREAIARRMAQLSAAARQILQVAAVAGDDFDVELAGAVLQCPPAALAPAWQSLEQAGLFAGGGFAHDLVRQTARQEVPAPIAQAMHRQIAAWLEARAQAGQRVHPARMATHWQAAGEWARAAPAYEAAAEEARRRSASREEQLALEAAIRCHRATASDEGRQRGFDAEVRRVRLLLRHDSAARAIDAAQALVAQAETPGQQAAALEVRAQVRGVQLENEAALEDAEAALALAADLRSSRLTLLAAQHAAGALVRLGRPLEAVALLDRLQPQAADLDDDERLHWLGDLATSLDHADRRREALTVLERTIDEAEGLGRWSAANQAWGRHAVALTRLGRLDESLRSAQRALDCAQRAGSEPAAQLVDRMNLAVALRDLGRYAEFLSIAEPLPLALREAGLAAWAVEAENHLALGYAWLGRLELAHRVLSPVSPNAAPTLLAARLLTEAGLQRLKGGAAARGPAEKLRHARALVESDGGRSCMRLQLEIEACRERPPEEALETLASIEAEARQREQVMLASHARLLRLQLQLQHGFEEAAGRTAIAMLDACDSEGPPPGLYLPELWWQAHRALASHDPDRAARSLERARAWIVEHALSGLPEVFHRSFLERNLVNAAVMQAVRKLA